MKTSTEAIQVMQRRLAMRVEALLAKGATEDLGR